MQQHSVSTLSQVGQYTNTLHVHPVGQCSSTVCVMRIMRWDSTATQYDMRHVLGQYSNTVCVIHITCWDSTATQCV